MIVNDKKSKFTICTKCGGEMLKTADKCPHCGYDRFSTAKAIIGLVVAAISIVILCNLL